MAVISVADDGSLAVSESSVVDVVAVGNAE